MPLDVSATQFCKGFDEYQRLARQEPIQVRSDGEVTGYFVSPETFERIQRITAASRRAYHPSELPDHVKAALDTIRMDSKHDHLDALLDQG